MRKTKQDNDMTDRIGLSILKLKLNYQDLLEWVRSMMKTILDNNMIDCTSMVYTKNDIELSWSIRLGVDYDKNQIGQLID